MASREPVVGWRIWRLQDGRLRSLVMDHSWEPGENGARCLAATHSICRRSPGEHCLCGFWAVWSPKQSLSRVCPAIEPPWQVMGLISGWGTVALHGSEGFRSERAAVRCLFTDRPWPWSARLLTRLGALWRLATGRGAHLDEPAPGLLDWPRQDALQTVAAHYAVPLLSLRAAADRGVLSELGVPQDRVAEATRLGGALSGVSPGEQA